MSAPTSSGVIFFLILGASLLPGSSISLSSRAFQAQCKTVNYSQLKAETSMRFAVWGLKVGVSSLELSWPNAGVDCSRICIGSCVRRGAMVPWRSSSQLSLPETVCCYVECHPGGVVMASRTLFPVPFRELKHTPLPLVRRIEPSVASYLAVPILAGYTGTAPVPRCLSWPASTYPYVPIVVGIPHLRSEITICKLLLPPYLRPQAAETTSPPEIALRNLSGSPTEMDLGNMLTMYTTCRSPKEPNSFRRTILIPSAIPHSTDDFVCSSGRGAL